jgi:adenosylcobinamide-phosphate synthase
VLLPAVYAAAASVALKRARGPLRFALEVWLLKSTFAVRGLVAAGRRVRLALEEGDPALARSELRALVSRPVDALDERLVISAAVESLTENTTDSYLAPWLAYAAGGVPAAMAYRAVNTLDAMWGYRTSDYEWFGKAAAYLDDALNFVPAWLASRLMLVAGGLQGLPAAEGRRLLAEQGGSTFSPNAGRTMATAAGLLAVRLEKPGAYRLGDPGGEPVLEHIRMAERLVEGVALAGLLWAIVAITAGGMMRADAR